MAVVLNAFGACRFHARLNNVKKVVVALEQFKALTGLGVGGETTTLGY